MINRYNKKQFVSLLDFIKKNRNDDFYYTDNNVRYVIKDELSLNTLLKSSNQIFTCEQDEVEGVILLWNSEGNNVKRNYIKITAISPKVAEQLITVLLWNCKQDLYIKINKESPFIPVFKSKGFVFFHFRGRELLLKKRNFSNVNDNNKE